ncbi:diguanylate cyclase [Saccharopolyspora sp. K220]|uniref:GGDEF domain-containing protein n=1 Tax=Saccharopolyspora soli TaxID=2926618 RepID=UPI001F57DA1C|nr:GGDEF domain-containing protein [Saccharopolyspora soli]MCI2422338.1 diguanylate cyclase [Saccharopolyspora soli]
MIPNRIGRRRHGVESSDRSATDPIWERAFTHAPIGAALLDLAGRWIDVNDAWCDLLGYSRQEMLSMRPADITYADDVESSAAVLDDLVSGRKKTATLKKRYRHKDGHPVWVLIRSSVIPTTDGQPACLVSYCEKLDDQFSSNTHLEHLALHDPLTGLANRTLFRNRLQHELAQLDGQEGAVAVLVIDLDELKPINDTYGHAAGDHVILAAADELLGVARPADTVARIGGDEFAIVRLATDAQAAEHFRDHIAQRLRAEREIGQWRLKIRGSVGLATTTDPATPPEVLLHDADRNMYWHKQNTRTNTGDPT